MTRRGRPLPLLLAVGLFAKATPALAQTWTADLYAGATQQVPLAGRTADVNLIGNLRYAGAAEAFLYLAAAAPLDGDAIPWAAAGLGRKLGFAGVGWAGLDLAAHGYAFRGRSQAEGAGGTLHVLPYVEWSGAAGSVELRAGRHEHRFRYEGDDSGRGLYEIGMSAGTSRGAWATQLTGRWLADDTTTFPFAGIEAGAVFGVARVWGSAGRWLASGAASTEWSAGAALDIARLGQVWVELGRLARDPLYENAERTSWNIGVSRPLGRRPGMTILPAASVREDGVVFRLPRRAVLGSDAEGVPSVAGEFSDWQPLAMRLDGDEWRLALPVRSGVHRFSFVTASGEWFVPEGYPGRIDDGMGGWVAVLVVP